MILVDDIFVYVNEDMPSGAAELVAPNPDGTYTILLNGNLSKKKQVDAFWHAINHIRNDDFERVELCGIQMVESEAHNKKPPILLQQNGRNRIISRKEMKAY